MIQIETENRSLTVPPLIPNHPTKRYNTVQGKSRGSKIWVVYENGRAYPEYPVRYYIGPRDPNRTPFSSRDENLLPLPSISPPPPQPQLEAVAHPSKIPQVPHITWEYDDSDEWQSFNLDLQTDLETAYQCYLGESHRTDLATMRYRFGKWEYEIDFGSMIQTNISHTNRTQRKARRFDDHVV